MKYNNFIDKLDVDRLASLKYHYIHRRVRTPFYTYLLWDGTSHHYNKDLSFHYEIKDILYLDSELMLNNDYWDKVQSLVLVKLENNPNFILDIFKKAYSLDSKIVKFVKSLQDKDFSSVSNTYLVEKLEKYVYLSVQASAFMLFPLVIEKFLENKISEVVMEKYKEEAKKIMQFLTTSIKQSSTQDEEINLLKIAIKQIRGENISDDVQGHVVKYRWLKNVAMDGQFYSEKDVFEKIANIQKEDLEEKLNNIFKEQKLIITRVNKYKLELRSDKKIVKFIDTLQKTIYFRSWRTERFYKNAQYLSKFFVEISKRIKLNIINDIFFFLPAEIINLLQDSLIAEQSIINERKEGYIMLGDGQKTNIYSGLIVNVAKEKIKFFDIQINSDIKGQVAYYGKITGIVCVINSRDDFCKMQQDNILVSHSTTPDYIPIIKKAKAIITNEGGITCHAAIIARELKKSCIIGTKIATKVLKDGDLVEVDADNGVVRILKKVKK